MYMNPYLFWQSINKSKQDSASKIWKDLNNAFITFLSCSWIIYMTAALIFGICTYFFYYDRRRRVDMQNRRQMMQRAQERPPQKRRPGAAYRDHQIYRHIMRTVSQYMKNPPLITEYVENIENKRLTDLRRKSQHNNRTTETTNAVL